MASLPLRPQPSHTRPHSSCWQRGGTSWELQERAQQRKGRSSSSTSTSSPPPEPPPWRPSGAHSPSTTRHITRRHSPASDSPTRLVTGSSFVKGGRRLFRKGGPTTPRLHHPSFSLGPAVPCLLAAASSKLHLKQRRQARVAYLVGDPPTRAQGTTRRQAS